VLATVGSVVVVIGLLLLLLGGIAFLVVAFRESVVWGLAVLVLPVASLVFLILHWSRAKDSFFLQLWGIAVVLLGTLALGADLPGPL
jgi:hypothetical protein